MIQPLYQCQVGDPNTRKFWNKKIKESKSELFSSPIYLHKNKQVSRYISGYSGRLLDVGVGYGFIEELITKKNKNLKIFGIDISDYSINNIKKKVKGVFKVASVSRIPFKNDYFGIVIALDILEHLTNSTLKIAFQEIYRVLLKNGLLIISVPINESDEDGIKNGHLQKFYTNDINNKIVEYGFKIISTKYLYAVRNNFYFKNLILRFFNLRKPNLVILVCKKI